MTTVAQVADYTIDLLNRQGMAVNVMKLQRLLFYVHARGAENVARLADLHARIQANDLALADPGGMGFAQRSGLALVVPSRLDPAIAQQVLEDDRAEARLQAAAQATGIAETLKAAGKGWYALSPAWKRTDSAGRNLPPETEVHFFLNPQEQKKWLCLRSVWVIV